MITNNKGHIIAYGINGFLNGKRVKVPDNNSQRSVYLFDGLVLDSLVIDEIKISKKEDIEQIIKFLEITKHCFKK